MRLVRFSCGKWEAYLTGRSPNGGCPCCPGAWKETRSPVCDLTEPVSAQTIEILKDHLAQPQTDQEKIPLSQCEFNPNQQVTADPPSELDLSNQRDRVYVVSIRSSCSSFWARSPVATMTRYLPQSLGQQPRLVLEMVLSGTTVRYRNHHTIAALKLPNFTSVLDRKKCFPWSRTASQLIRAPN